MNHLVISAPGEFECPICYDDVLLGYGHVPVNSVGDVAIEKLPGMKHPICPTCIQGCIDRAKQDNVGERTNVTFKCPCCREQISSRDKLSPEEEGTFLIEAEDKRQEPVANSTLLVWLSTKKAVLPVPLSGVANKPRSSEQQVIEQEWPAMARRLDAEWNGGPNLAEQERQDAAMARRLDAELNGGPNSPEQERQDAEIARRLDAELNGGGDVAAGRRQGQGREENGSPNNEGRCRIS